LVPEDVRILLLLLLKHTRLCWRSDVPKMVARLATLLTPARGNHARSLTDDAGARRTGARAHVIPSLGVRQLAAPRGAPD
jgi:hypothetical protein